MSASVATRALSSASLRELFASVEPYRTEMIDVGDGHVIYYEESGNPEGLGVLIAHGGPGGGSSPEYRRFFDPKKYRICQFDQRGCGKSTPWASLENNSTWHTVADMELIRERYIQADKVALFGGSWGSTICLAYAEKFPERVRALILRGIFTLRREELLFFYNKGGSSFLYPEEFERYESVIPEEERGDMMAAFYKRLTGDDEEEKARVAHAWTRWEMATSKLFVDPASLERADDPKFAIAFARIECHYFVNGGFFESDDQIIARAKETLSDIPTWLVSGRYDLVCPHKTHHDLHTQLPHATSIVVPDAGHSCFEPGIRSALIQATDDFWDSQN